MAAREYEPRSACPAPRPACVRAPSPASRCASRRALPTRGKGAHNVGDACAAREGTARIDPVRAMGRRARRRRVRRTLLPLVDAARRARASLAVRQAPTHAVLAAVAALALRHRGDVPARAERRVHACLRPTPRAVLTPAIGSMIAPERQAGGSAVSWGCARALRARARAEGFGASLWVEKRRSGRASRLRHGPTPHAVWSALSASCATGR